MNDLAPFRNPTSINLSIPLAPSWHAQAACTGVKDPEIFFPGEGGSVSSAKAICASCPVRLKCLEANLSETSGVFGGTTPRERQAIRKQRKRRAA